MNQPVDLSRFTEAHKRSFRTALQEIQNGQKRSHWMWYIFPQVCGLGHTSTSQLYAIQSLEEAIAFLQDPYLGGNLLEICRALLALETDSAEEVFGKTDKKKLRSSMTLFSLVSWEDPIFQQVLDKFFNNTRQEVPHL